MDLSQIPTSPPPPGIKSNFVDPSTQAPVTKITISILLPLMVLFVFLRLYTNIWISRKMETSDYACIVATVAAVSYSAVIYYTLHMKFLGLHLWDVPLSLFTDSALQALTTLNILYGPVMFLAKLSILLLYLRIFLVNRRTRILVYIGLTWNALLSLATIVVGILCVPLPGRSWQLASQDQKCRRDALLFSLINGVITFFSDVFIIGIPIPAVWNLQLQTSKKLGVITIFATGGLACFASLLSVVYRVKQYKDGDQSWTSAITYLLTAVEIDVGIMCSCMPSYTHYLRHLIGLFRLFKSRLRSKSFQQTGSLKEPSILRFKRLNRIGLNQARDVQLALESALRNEDSSARDEDSSARDEDSIARDEDSHSFENLSQHSSPLEINNIDSRETINGDA